MRIAEALSKDSPLSKISPATGLRALSSKPITVVADGRTVFEGMVKPNVSTLLKWAAKDNDRTMLFGAELPIKLGN